MSVDIWVPEQSLVTVTPEELLLSDVLVFVLSWPFVVRQVTQVLSVLGVLELNVSDWDGSQSNDWKSNEVSDLGPQLGDTLRVVHLLVVFSDKLFAGLLVVSEGILSEELRVTVAVAVGVESDEVASSQVSEHDYG